MLKILGYIISIIGLIALALTVETVKKIVSLQLPPQLNNTILTIVGVVILLIGIFLVIKNPDNSATKNVEVPIYQGNQIIGYRRV